jgi:predicted MFS family arabinose efflux permease
VTGLMAGGLLAEAFGWRMAFLLMALPGLVIGAILYFTILEPQRGRYAPKGSRTDQMPVDETLKSLLTNKVYLGLVAGFAVQIMIGYAMAFWMAPVMLRNFDVSTSQVAVYLGLAFLLGGIPGPVAGGFLTDWLTKSDERWRAWLPGVVSLLALVPLYFSFNAGSFWPFLGLFALSYGIYVSSQAPILSGIQAAVEPNQRGFAVAFALFFNNLIGQAVGLGVIGWLSDRMTPTSGDGALGDAVMIVCTFAGVLAMAIFAWTASKMRSSGYLARMGRA